MEKVESIRGKQKIMHNGYVYVKQKDLAAGVTVTNVKSNEEM